MMKKAIWFCSSLFLLSACTMMVMDMTQGKEMNKSLYEQDKLLGFAYGKAGSQHIPANSLVMLGEQYIYVMSPTASKRNSQEEIDLNSLLHAPLSQAFTVKSYATQKSRYTNEFQVELNHISSQSNRFLSSFCLNYQINPKLPQAEQIREQNILNQLGFAKEKQNHQLCMLASGWVYTRPDDMVYQHQFEQYIPINIRIVVEGVETKPPRLLLRGILLPFAAATDIVSLPLYVVQGALMFPVLYQMAK